VPKQKPKHQLEVPPTKHHQFPNILGATLLREFEKDGYVTRIVSEKDKRQYQIYPTEKAKAVYEQIHGIAVASEDRLTRNFTEIEREVLKNLLDKVIANLE